MINVANGRVELAYNLYNNKSRVVAFDPKRGHPVDTGLQDLALEPNRIHY
jgi:hypothetical protein